MTDPGVRVHRDGPVATVTLCRPHVLNAQTPQMWGEIRAIARDLPGDIRVVVVRGEGRAFSAGLDLAAVSSGPENPNSLARIAAMPDDAASAQIAEYQDAFDWLRRPDLVSIAAVRGHAIGAGFQLALACDLRVCTQDCQFTMAEVSLGLVPDLGGTKRLVELVGYARALDICVTGRRVDAAEAERIGLANVVVPPGPGAPDDARGAPDAADGLDEAVAALTARILAVSRDAVVEIKALLAAAAGRTFADQERAEREAQVRLIRALVSQGEQ
jgi:enoyl-CoA hydratase/carnithine racemase